jgi:Zn-finger nucleic acid-binding protein
MELFERRRYYFCRYCGSFHFIESPEVDGVQVLAHAAGSSCPVCATPLVSALLDGRHAARHCGRCRGLLLSRDAFVDVVTRRRAFASGPATVPEPLDPRELQRRTACPTCHEAMDVHPYYGPGNIVIDSCPRCDVIWLDYGELKQVSDAPGKDRGGGHGV